MIVQLLRWQCANYNYIKSPVDYKANRLIGVCIRYINFYYWCSLLQYSCLIKYSNTYCLWETHFKQYSLLEDHCSTNSISERTAPLTSLQNCTICNKTARHDMALCFIKKEYFQEMFEYRNRWNCHIETISAISVFGDFLRIFHSIRSIHVVVFCYILRNVCNATSNALTSGIIYNIPENTVNLKFWSTLNFSTIWS